MKAIIKKIKKRSKYFFLKIEKKERKTPPIVLNTLKKIFNKLLIFFNPRLYIKGVKVLLTEGPFILIEKIKLKIYEQKNIYRINQRYQIWLKKNYPSPAQVSKQSQLIKSFKYQPLISIITPVYNPEKKHLIDCIESVINQSYKNWELCLVDDASTKKYVKQILLGYQKKDKRIKIKFRAKNGHICRASNDALKLATGEFVALLDHDDFLWPNALYEVVKLLNKKPHAQFIYSDEDKLDYDGKTHIDPFFKPDWSPDYLRSINYITHFAVLKKSLVDKIGGFRVGTEGAQDWDLFLRATYWLEKNIGHCHPLDKKNPILHISTVLYSWRKTLQSTASEKNIKKVKKYSYKNQVKVVKYFYKKIINSKLNLLINQSMPGIVDVKVDHRSLNFLRIFKSEFICNKIKKQCDLKEIIPHMIGSQNKIFIDFSKAKDFFTCKKSLQNSLHYFYSKKVINNFYSKNPKLINKIKEKKIPFFCKKSTFINLLNNRIKLDEIFFLSKI